ncbi:E3 ubiquitin-protein ligase Kcmf1-like isoform X1 [Aedes albopictus]|uniref:RING-type domain-containing protein n=1 Tax=Aedes albopictus TaxID=7160 RepID=A0ABM1YI69_AEDAL
MSRIHLDISCDECGWNNFSGIRYACLVCEQYDLCEMCYCQRCSGQQHVAYHPMQAIFPKYPLFQDDREVAKDDLRLCCPYCGEKDLRVHEMFQHCQRFHSSDTIPVRCPICLMDEDRNRNLLQTSLLEHMLTRHKEYEHHAQDCTICMEPMVTTSNIEKLQCGHPFHSGCISNWLQNNDNCPLCRAPVRNRGKFIDDDEFLPM